MRRASGGSLFSQLSRQPGLNTTESPTPVTTKVGAIGHQDQRAFSDPNFTWTRP